MESLVDELVTAEADEVSRRLAALGLPNVGFVFWGPDSRPLASWRDAPESDRRRALEAFLRAAPAGLTRQGRLSIRVG